jgi:ferrous iron transport protein A
MGGHATLLLGDLPLQVAATVVAVNANDADMDASRVRRLTEIGFLPGEPVKIVARIPGGDPLAVRIGNSTFALRRREAACVQVQVG